MRRWVVVAALLAGGPAWGAAPEPSAPPPEIDPLEKELFGDPDEPEVTPPPTGDAPPVDDGAGDDDPFSTLDSKPIVIEEDPLTIGGQLYLRLGATINDRGSAGEQRLSMPNLVDVYLDARPEDRVRGFVSGRLYFDPTIDEGEASLLGTSQEVTRVLLDQLWLKTDIARRVFLTVGQERIKWGSSRIWNPTDFINARRKDPLAFFDERTGVPMIKAHIPIESWNLYVIGLFGQADRLDAIGAAARLEMAFEATEIAVSALAGDERKTSFGLDLSTALGDFDVTAEVSLTDEHDTLVYEGDCCSFDPPVFPSARARDAWVARFSAGIQYGFKVDSEDDAQYVGLEYFYNPLGYDDPDIYPWLLVNDAFEPFYLGRHYLGFNWVVPAPGRWDDVTFSFAFIGNLSDESYVTRLDFVASLHTRLTLQAYAQAHFGHRGGELRLAFDVPDIPAIPGVVDEPIEAFSVPAPAVLLGLNLRIAL
ncbi:MAG: hypothetical protein IT385_24245 [Deltaproteobacteria bacterium]|nr:hypothetical protein [Deltaproteobacteria bacterium]